MSYIFSKDTLITHVSGQPNYCYAVYALKELLKTAGWTVTKSGTGTGGSFSTSSDLITSATVLAGATPNTIYNQWFILKHPTSSLEICFQRSYASNDTSQWRIKVSPGGFGTTSASATRIPTPSPDDSVSILGGGTDASPSYGSLCQGNVNSRYHCCADNAAPYGFYMLGHLVGSTTTHCGFIFDPLAASSYPTEDTQPWVCGALPVSYTPWSTGSLQQNFGADSSGGGFGYLGSPATPSNLRSMIAYATGGYSYQHFPDKIVTNQFNSNDDTLALLWGRATNQLPPPFGFKGISSMIHWMGVTRSLGNTLSVSTARDRYCIGNVTLPWDGTVPNI